MYKPEHKPKEEKGKTASNQLIADKSKTKRKKTPAQFNDNRPESVQMKKLQELIGHGPKIQPSKTTVKTLQKKDEKHTLQMVGNLSRRFEFVVNGVNQHHHGGGDDRQAVEHALRNIPNFLNGNAYWNGNAGLNVWVHTTVGTPVAQVRNAVNAGLPAGAYIGEITRRQ